jgi:hypothetical protein
MAVIAGAAQHRVSAVNFPWEENAVPVEGQERVLLLMELKKIIGIRHTDRRPVVAVAPRHIISILQPASSGIIAVLETADFPINSDESNRLFRDIPMKAVLAHFLDFGIQPIQIEIHLRDHRIVHLVPQRSDCPVIYGYPDEINRKKHDQECGNELDKYLILPRYPELDHMITSQTRLAYILIFMQSNK